MYSPKRTKKIWQRGFTITELLVSIGIMLLITGILITRYGTFNSAVLLKSQAYEVALLIRKAQLYAVSSQSDEGNYQYSDRYGVYLSKGDQTYVLYRNENADSRYNAGTDVALETAQLDDRFELRDIVDADNGGDPVGDGDISIVFTRPNFDAVFYDGSGLLGVGVVYLEIVTSDGEGNDSGTLRTVEVTSAGQITVQ